MFEVFYYHEKLDKWIKACTVRTEKQAQDEVKFLERLRKQPAKYVRK